MVGAEEFGQRQREGVEEGDLSAVANEELEKQLGYSSSRSGENTGD